MSNIKELIRQKIDAYYAKYKAKFHQNGGSYHLGIIDGLDMAERILDTLPDEPASDELEEAAEKYWSDYPAYNDDQFIAENAFNAGAEWQKRKMISALKNDGELPIEFIDKFHEIDRNAFQNGQKNMKEQMMEGAVEGEVCGRCYGHLNIRFADGVYKYLEPKNISHIPADVSKYNIGDKVKIIIVKEGEQ